ncbi:hypothetical protein [Nocardia pneumoniae]|uniref:hypothetical protein n=1 Tax=Nocardia pneumoniae TaxID=228601 RepID=UPI001FE118BC|nr:hypothetical protein [Nocardia pneumoniae]
MGAYGRPFAEGSTGTLRPKKGPKVRFVIARLTDSEFVDVSKLFGARLRFAHQVTTTEGRTTVTVTVSIDGPLRRLWSRILGADLVESVQPDLDALVTVAERVAA